MVLAYLLLMKGWLGVIGDTTLALRAPSVVAAVGLVAVLAALATPASWPGRGVTTTSRRPSTAGR